MEALSEVIQSIPRESLALIIGGIVALAALIVIAIVAIVESRHNPSEPCGIEIGITGHGAQSASPIKFPDFELKGERLIRVQDAGGRSHLMYCRHATVSALRRTSRATETEQFAWAGSSSGELVLTSSYKCASSALGWIEVHKWYQEVFDLNEFDDVDLSKVELDVKMDLSVPIAAPITLDSIPCVTV